MTNFIQNVSFQDAKEGNHLKCHGNSMLIQIMDPDTFQKFPETPHKFKEVHQFRFFDIEWTQMENDRGCTDEHAFQLVSLLKHAVDEGMDVIVHCMAGKSRSGAVCEVGIAMGLQDTHTYRNPNRRVKKKMFEAMKKLNA